MTLHQVGCIGFLSGMLTVIGLRMAWAWWSTRDEEADEHEQESVG